MCVTPTTTVHIASHPRGEERAFANECTMFILEWIMPNVRFFLPTTPSPHFFQYLLYHIAATSVILTRLVACTGCVCVCGNNIFFRLFCIWPLKESLSLRTTNHPGLADGCVNVSSSSSRGMDCVGPLGWILFQQSSHTDHLYIDSWISHEQPDHHTRR